MCGYLTPYLLAILLTACGSSSVEGDAGPDSSSGTDSDADSDTDTDSDADTDTDSEPDAGDDSGVPMMPGDYDDPTALNWVLIDGGTFLQGAESSASPASYSETPAHDVTLPSFEIMTTEVTTSQYAQCVLASVCEEPLVAQGDGVGKECNWLWWGRDDHPVNCISAYEAEEYCNWIDTRLPTESEWEYAARSGGQDNEYPWGEEETNCDFAVYYLPYVGAGCGLEHTWPVCSKVAGNTAQGLCDMGGNVREWVQDCWYGSYNGAPTDGSAGVVESCEDNVLRGGGYGNIGTSLRTWSRAYNPSFGRGDSAGFRCARAPE